MKWKNNGITWTLAIALLAFANTPLIAGDFYINLYGYSHHLDSPSDKDLNEDNLGWGLKYHVNENFYIDGGRFIDSDRNTSRYVGAALQTSNRELLSVGIEAFYMRRPSYQHGEPFWAALPFLALNTGRVTTMMGYIPERKTFDYTLYKTVFVFWSIKL